MPASRTKGKTTECMVAAHGDWSNSRAWMKTPTQMCSQHTLLRVTPRTRISSIARVSLDAQSCSLRNHIEEEPNVSADRSWKVNDIP